MGRGDAIAASPLLDEQVVLEAARQLAPLRLPALEYGVPTAAAIVRQVVGVVLYVHATEGREALVRAVAEATEAAIGDRSVDWVDYASEAEAVVTALVGEDG